MFITGDMTVHQRTQKEKAITKPNLISGDIPHLLTTTTMTTSWMAAAFALSYDNIAFR
jgi:hypothetical protein